jgi:hypothetical protein
MGLLDSAGMQKLWTKIKNKFVQKDSNGKATVAGLKVTDSGIDCDGVFSANDGASFGGSVEVKYGETFRLYNEDNSKSADMCCESDGKLSLDGLAIATEDYVDDKVANISGGTSNPQYSEGLEYTLSTDGTYYEVSGIGTCTDEHIVIPRKYNGLPVKQIRQLAFNGNTKIMSVSLPDTIIGIGQKAFKNCIRLYEINIPKDIQSIAYQAFYGCSVLRKIFISNGLAGISALNVGGEAFGGCSFLTIYCEMDSQPSSWNATWNPNNRPVVWGAITDVLQVNEKLDEFVTETELDEKNFATESYVDEKVANIPSGGGSGDSSIIDLGEQGDHKVAQQAMIDHIMGIEASYCLFKYYCNCSETACFAIVYRLPDDYVRGVVYDSNRRFREFNYSIGNEELTLDECWTPISSFNDEFEELPTEDKSVKGAIDEIYALTVDGYKPSNLEYGYGSGEDTYTVYGADTSIEEVLIPSKNSGILVTDIGNRAFMGYTNLTKVVIPNSVTSIGYEAFRDCDSLVSVVIGDSVTSIGYYAFRYCPSLTSVVIGNSVTFIGVQAFESCSSLTRIIIPASVTSIGAFTFEGCDNLTIYCEAESKPEGWVEEWNPDNRPVVWGFANNFVDVNNKLAEIGSGGSGGATLSMPRIRFANYEYEEDVAYSYEQALCTRGRVVFSVNVQDGTLQEGDELQVCSMRSVFDKKKLRPILSRTITAEDIENLTKQPYLQISTDDFSGNSLGKNSMRALTSFHRTDSSTPEARKPKYIRIRRPVWKENKNGDVVVVNASFSNVVPIQFNLRCGSED